MIRDWKKYGPASVCFWSLILVVVGLCQLTFGAYYIVKLPVFKIASPVWTGFLNMLCGAVLFGLHHKTLDLRRKILAARAIEANSSPLSNWRRACRWGLYLSLCISLFSVLINTANLIICEVGEWQHWLTYVERKKLKEGPLSLFALQAYRISSAQMGAAIFIGVVCTSLNLWHLCRNQKHSGEDCGKSKAGSGGRTVSRRSSSVASSKKNTSRLPTGYDNANWVYGDEVDNVHSHPEPSNRGVFMTSSSLQSPAVHLPAQMTAPAVRYATIRRAASILPSLPDNFTTMRSQQRSLSFREDQQSHPIVSVKRSHTVSQAPIPPGFAHRFQLNPEPLSDLSFIHNGLDKRSQAEGETKSAPNEEIPDAQMIEAARKPPLPPIVPNSYVRNSDRIVLRVESFRTHPVSALNSTVERSPSAVGLPVLIHKRPIRNIKRVSSSTQTELSVLKRNPSPATVVSGIRPSPLTKRFIPLEKPWSTTEEYSPPPKTTPELSTMQTSPGYSIGSSSGYSSPRSSNDSKSPTPEPLSNHAADISAESGQTSQSSLNVTVIRIDPGATSNHIWTEEIQQEVKRVNQLDHSTPIRTMQSKPLSRTVSFRHQPTTQRKCSPVPNNNWIYSNLATDYNRSPIIPIPRPVLRYSNINENWSGRSQHSANSTPSTLSRRTAQQLHLAAGRNVTSNVERSASLAATEIQRKLEFLQRRGEPIPARISPVPIHEPYSDSGYQDEDQSWFSIQRHTYEDASLNGDVSARRKKFIRPSGVALAQEVDELNSTQTLAYLSQLENLARHWKTQLMYKVELKSSSEGTASPIDQDSFQC